MVESTKDSGKIINYQCEECYKSKTKSCDNVPSHVSIPYPLSVLQQNLQIANVRMRIRTASVI